MKILMNQWHFRLFRSHFWSCKCVMTPRFCEKNPFSKCSQLPLRKFDLNHHYDRASVGYRDWVSAGFRGGVSIGFMGRVSVWFRVSVRFRGRFSFWFRVRVNVGFRVMVPVG